MSDGSLMLAVARGEGLSPPPPMLCALFLAGVALSAPIVLPIRAMRIALRRRGA